MPAPGWASNCTRMSLVVTTTPSRFTSIGGLLLLGDATLRSRTGCGATAPPVARLGRHVDLDRARPEDQAEQVQVDRREGQAEDLERAGSGRRLGGGGRRGRTGGRREQGVELAEQVREPLLDVLDHVSGRV